MLAEKLQDRPLKISIVTPSFNQARFIEATIISVVEQTYPFIEYLIVDGGSTDGSVEIIRKYEKFLAYWCSEPDRGQADAIRKGFERATGDILCWLNSDDLLLPGALQRIADYFERNPYVETLSAGAVMIDGESRVFAMGRCVYTLGVRASSRRLLHYGQGGVAQCATFWRKEAYEAVGGINCQYHFIMDLDLFVRLARRRRFGVLKKLVACYRIHPAAKSSTIQDIHQIELQSFRSSYGVNCHNQMGACIVRAWYTATSKVQRTLLWARWKFGRAIGQPVFRGLPAKTCTVERPGT